MNKLLYYFVNPDIIILRLAGKGIIQYDDEKYIRKQFKEAMGYEIDLENPITFDEKLNWLKIHDRNPLYEKMVDKYEVKEYVSKVIGQEYVIPALGVYDLFDEIDFQSLPKQFVMKCTHDSGSVVIVKDKNLIDMNLARKVLSRSMKRNFFYINREWPYKNIKPRILIEEYMEDSQTGELRDYKFYCFDGVVKAMLMASNRQNKDDEVRFNYYDSYFNKLELTNHWHPRALEELKKPLMFEKMVELASELSQGFPHVRIDFYEVNGHILFGEFTFYDQGGYLKIHPDDWSKEWGELINLDLAYDNRKVYYQK